MRVSFRQGIVQYQVDNQNNQNFLLATNTGISLLANDTPFVATFAHKDANYLLEEKLSVINAWAGPFIGQQNYWLYIDLQPVTGLRTFGTTTIQPFVGPYAPPSVRVDYHWYDTSAMQMKVWNGHGWHPVIRVFVGQAIGGSNTFLPMTNTGTYGGSQIGDNSPNFAGNIVYDAYGKPLRASNQTFFTTESITTVRGSTGNVRLASDLLTATALESIPAYSVVYFYDFDVIKLATPSLTLEPRIFGIVTQDLQPNDTCFVYTDCVITNDKWDWGEMSASVYADVDGSVTTLQQLDQQSIGYTVAHNAIRVEPLSTIINKSTNTGSDLTLQQLYGLLGKVVGSLSINGPSEVTEGTTADYGLTFIDTNTGFENNNAKAHIGVSGNVAYIDGNNRLYVPKLTDEMDVTLSAYYPYGLTVIEAYKTVHLAKALPISIQISGPAHLYEGTTGAYTTLATYPDGSTQQVSPVYTITQTTVAAVNSSNLGVLMFDAAGIASNVTQIQDTITATLTLSNGTTLTSSMPVSYLRILPISLAVSGASQVLAGRTSQYTSTVSYNDGTSKVIASTWSLTDQVGMSNLNTTGLLTTGKIFAPSQVVVKASYTEHGVTVNSQETVQILVPAMYGTGEAAPADLATFIANLQYSNNGGKSADFAIDAVGQSTYMWFAYPMSYGTAQFYDVISQQFGGWDGAGSPGNYATATGGPIQVSMNSNGVGTVWYVYRTDHANLGTASINHWQVS